MSKGLAGGHAYCSSPTLNREGLKATVVSLIAAIAFGTFRHAFPFLTPSLVQDHSSLVPFNHLFSLFAFSFLALFTIASLIYQFLNDGGIEASESFASYIIGLIYGGGLMLSGVIRPSIVIGGLTLQNWNPAFWIVITTVMLSNYVVYYFLVGKLQPMSSEFALLEPVFDEEDQ